MISVFKALEIIALESLHITYTSICCPDWTVWEIKSTGLFGGNSKLGLPEVFYALLIVAKTIVP